MQNYSCKELKGTFSSSGQDLGFAERLFTHDNKVILIVNHELVEKELFQFSNGTCIKEGEQLGLINFHPVKGTIAVFGDKSLKVCVHKIPHVYYSKVLEQQIYVDAYCKIDALPLLQSKLKELTGEEDVNCKMSTIFI
jgi:hypothetical protein